MCGGEAAFERGALRVTLAAPGPLSAPKRHLRSGRARAPSRRCSSPCWARAEGVTVAEAAQALGWQPHTVRGAFAGALKKRLGLNVTSEKVEGKERIYRLD